MVFQNWLTQKRWHALEKCLHMLLQTLLVHNFPTILDHATNYYVYKVQRAVLHSPNIVHMHALLSGYDYMPKRK